MTETTTTEPVRLPTLATTGSTMPHVHRAAGVLREALASVPAYADAAARCAAIAAIGLGPAPTPADLADELTDALDQGEDVDGRWLLERAAGAEAVGRARAEAGKALNRARAAAVAELDNAVRAGADRLYGHLNTALADVLATARELLPTLGSTRDMEQAVAADKVDELQQWRQLADRYAEVRRWQRTLHSQLDHRLSQLPTPLAFIADPIAADREFVYRRLELWVPDASVEGDARPPRPAPWPDLAAADALDWLAQHPESRAWVPTPHQLAQAEAKVNDAISEIAQDAAPGPTRTVHIQSSVLESQV